MNENTEFPQDRQQPWEQLEGEPNNAYHAFECYRDRPPWERSMIRVAREYLGKPTLMQVPGYVKSWKKEFLWEERAHEFDRMVSRKRTEALVEAQVEEAAKKGRSIAELEFYLFESMASAHRILRELEKKEGFLEDFRPQDYNSLVGRLTEGYTSAYKARAEKDPDSLDAVENGSYEEAVKAIKEAAEVWGNTEEGEE